MPTSSKIDDGLVSTAAAAEDAETWKDRVQAATVSLPEKGGQGVLVPGGFIVSAAHCVTWTLKGGMALGDHCLELVKTKSGKSFHMAVLAVEPVTDVAVLGAPDNQAFGRDAEAFELFCEMTAPVPVHGEDFKWDEAVTVHVLSHKGTWLDAKAESVGQHEAAAGVSLTAKGMESGTSGGPVVDDAGRLVGVVSHDAMIPRLHRALPGWIWHRIETAQRKLGK